ncbi:MAG: hypothetical protein HYY16_18170 [Planctomycetes bacterium]|nr:hypothetical protein [Planctomycetota bacterium]
MSRKAFVEKKAKEREEIREKVQELSKKRDAFIEDELKKRGSKDAFDEVVLQALHDQAAKKGIKFDDK